MSGRLAHHIDERAEAEPHEADAANESEESGAGHVAPDHLGESDAAHLEESADQVGAAGRGESLPREVLGRQKLRNRPVVEIELDEQSF